jgi:hypothetical protein
VIIGAHSIIYSRNPDADRALLRDVLELPSVDVGGGWLIFGLPPAEVAVHPSDENDVHELYLMCEDIAAFADAMRERNVDLGPVLDRGWGLLSELSLPGGGKLGIYEPRHARPAPPVAHRKPAKKIVAKQRAATKKRPAKRASVRTSSQTPAQKTRATSAKARRR